jgi:peptidoglycan hydrolase-like protein with peptidoglycan-binding domain
MKLRRSALIVILLTAVGVGVVRADQTTSAVQEALKEQGFYYGDVTGKKTAETTAAIRRYQIRNGLQITENFALVGRGLWCSALERATATNGSAGRGKQRQRAANPIGGNFAAATACWLSSTSWTGWRLRTRFGPWLGAADSERRIRRDTV